VDKIDVNLYGIDIVFKNLEDLMNRLNEMGFSDQIGRLMSKFKQSGDANLASDCEYALECFAATVKILKNGCDYVSTTGDTYSKVEADSLTIINKETREIAEAQKIRLELNGSELGLTTADSLGGLGFSALEDEALIEYLRNQVNKINELLNQPDTSLKEMEMELAFNNYHMAYYKARAEDYLRREMPEEAREMFLKLGLDAEDADRIIMQQDLTASGTYQYMAPEQMLENIPESYFPRYFPGYDKKMFEESAIAWQKSLDLSTFHPCVPLEPETRNAAVASTRGLVEEYYGEAPMFPDDSTGSDGNSAIFEAIKKGEFESSFYTENPEFLQWQLDFLNARVPETPVIAQVVEDIPVIPEAPVIAPIADIPVIMDPSVIQDTEVLDGQGFFDNIVYNPLVIQVGQCTQEYPLPAAVVIGIASYELFERNPIEDAKQVGLAVFNLPTTIIKDATIAAEICVGAVGALVNEVVVKPVQAVEKMIFGVADNAAPQPGPAPSDCKD